MLSGTETDSPSRADTFTDDRTHDVFGDFELLIERNNSVSRCNVNNLSNSVYKIYISR
jgi:hypothetical protein